MPPTSPPHSAGQKAPLMRRQSSQSSQASKQGVASPGSGGDYQPLRHAVKSARRTKIVLPRNHSSARDLAKLARQAQNHRVSEEDARNPQRHRSHEGDTEIRLPGSLDEHEAQAQPMRRNMTAYQLPRNPSHTKLKKNLSHGQLTRIGSGRNLAGLNERVRQGPPSPGLQQRKKRPKSADMGLIVKDMHEQEAEAAQEREEEQLGPKKVGFDVGSSGDGEGEAPDMEGSGMQEDEWTDQSGSASPYSTRLNTANNSRRASVTQERPPDKRVLDSLRGKAAEQLHHPPSHLASEVKPESETGDDDDEDDEDGEDEDEDEDRDEESESDTPPSPRSQPHMHLHKKEEVKKSEEAPPQEPQPKAQTRSPLNAAKDHPNPATRYLLGRRPSAAQAQLSVHEGEGSAQASPAPSMRSSRSNIGDGHIDQDQEELVSRFIPSASHPSTGSVGGTTANTPKSGSFHTPDHESTLAAQNRGTPKTSFQFPTPVSPGSTVSGSSGAATPAMSRSRTEMRMMNEKAVADLEDAAARNPVIPAHVYDRRNESLKTYLSAPSFQRNGSSNGVNPNFNLGPELFQGRFKAVNTELKVVQRFRDPIAESVRRMDKCKPVNFAHLRGKRTSTPQQTTKVPISRSAVNLQRGPSKLATSASPPKSASPVKPAMSTTKSAANVRSAESRRGKVTFSQTPPELHEPERFAGQEERGIAQADAVARVLWESVLG